MRLIYTIITLFALPYSLSAEDSIKYINQSGSTMEFKVSDSGTVEGYYKTALGCDVGIKRPLSGFKNGTAITFTVSFEECGSITSWVGHVQDSGDIITIWTLARGNEGWDAKLTGTSTFKVVK